MKMKREKERNGDREEYEMWIPLTKMNRRGGKKKNGKEYGVKSVGRIRIEKWKGKKEEKVDVHKLR